jgi:hypothetical protein
MEHILAVRFLPFQSCNPVYRKNSFLCIQVYCMKVKYTPDPSHNKPGKLTSSSGQPFDLAADADWFWTAVPMYKW